MFDPEKLLEHYNSDTFDGIEQYIQAAWKRKDVIWGTLKIVTTPESKKNFLGQWVLQDEDGNSIDKTHRWGASEYFYIVESEEKLKYTYKFKHSYIHYSDHGEFYISTNWDAGIIKQLKIFDSRLYLYVLLYDNWILDPIHKWGKYFYVKHPLR
jgi:hypothetical protein